MTELGGKVISRAALNRRLAGTSWGASTPTLRTPILHSCTHQRNVVSKCDAEAHTRDSWMSALRAITWCLIPTQVDQLPVLTEIAPPALDWEAATLVLGCSYLPT